MVYRTSDNNFATAKWIVDPTPGQGTHTTIASAIASASSGDIIAIRPATYTENLTLKNGVNFSGLSFLSGAGPTVLISGKMIDNGSTVNATFTNIAFQTNSDNILALTGSASDITFSSCRFDCSGSTGISVSSGTTAIFNNCSGDLHTTGINLFTGAGSIQTYYCNFNNSGSSTTGNSGSGSVFIYYSIINFVLSTSSSGGIIVTSSTIDTSLINTTSITTSGNGFARITSSTIFSGTASAISIGSSTTGYIYNIVVNSSNTNAITGSGTLNYSDITFSGSSSTINTTTTSQSPNGLPFSISNGGTGVTSVTTSPTASAWAGWDANSNMSANNFNTGYATTVTAAGTTTLTVASAGLQYFTGSTTQTVKLPVASTLTLGMTYQIVNNSTSSVFVQSSGGNTVKNIAGSASATYTCIATSGTTAASWSYQYNRQSIQTAIDRINIQSFTSSGTYTPTATTQYVVIECWGGGAAGGAGYSGTPGGGGGGGGAGGYSRLVATAATIGASQTVTISGAGASTTFGALITCNGGSAGSAGTLTNGGAGGAGGTASGGTVNITGGSGNAGSVGTTAVSGSGGSGGNTSLGGAGGGSSGSTAGLAASANSGAGGGGGGTAVTGGTGGAGSSGTVIVTEYLSQ